MVLALLLAACGSDDRAEPGSNDLSTRVAVYAAPLGLPVWYVDCEGGGDFETISDAIEAAQDGDWIAVAPCTYEESLDLEGKSVWIASTGSSEDTILDPGNQRAILASQGTGDGSALVGFTITGARDDSVAVIYADMSALRLQDVVIEDSYGAYGILYAYGSDVELQDVVVDSSARPGYYGYIVNSRGAIIADNLSVSCRAGSYAFYTGHGSYFVDHSDLDCSGGYAYHNEHSVGRVHRSTLNGAVSIVSEDDHYDDPIIFENVHFTGNIAVEYGSITIRNSFVDGGTITTTNVYDLEIESSIVAHQRCAIQYSFTPAEVDSGDDPAPDPEVEVLYSNFWDVDHENCDNTTTYTGENGNISVDPEFADEDGGDYSLSSGSPLIDAGMPDEIYNDPDGTTNDIGLYGGPRSMGGGW